MQCTMKYYVLENIKYTSIQIYQPNFKFVSSFDVFLTLTLHNKDSLKPQTFSYIQSKFACKAL